MFDESAQPAPALPVAPYETPQGDCRMASRPAGHVLQILAPPFAAGIPQLLSELTDGVVHALRSSGPGVWYLVGNAPLSPREISQLEIRLGSQVQIIDQTHGRVRLELSGPGAARLLSTGTAVDLSLRGLPVGSACETLFGHIGIHLTRTGPERFEVLVGRSFAVSLWEEMIC